MVTTTLTSVSNKMSSLSQRFVLTAKPQVTEVRSVCTNSQITFMTAEHHNSICLRPLGMSDITKDGALIVRKGNTTNISTISGSIRKQWWGDRISEGQKFVHAKDLVARFSWFGFIPVVFGPVYFHSRYHWTRHNFQTQSAKERPLLMQHLRSGHRQLALIGQVKFLWIQSRMSSIRCFSTPYDSMKTMSKGSRVIVRGGCTPISTFESSRQDMSFGSKKRKYQGDGIDNVLCRTNFEFDLPTHLNSKPNVREIRWSAIFHIFSFLSCWVIH